MTPEHKALARHALGLPNERNRSYRNHFVTGPGSHDYPGWLQMVGDGTAQMRKGSEMSGGDPIFWLTREGAELALQKGEWLDREDFDR